MQEWENIYREGGENPMIRPRPLGKPITNNPASRGASVTAGSRGRVHSVGVHRCTGITMENSVSKSGLRWRNWCPAAATCTRERATKKNRTDANRIASYNGNGRRTSGLIINYSEPNTTYNNGY